LVFSLIPPNLAAPSQKTQITS